MTTQLAFHKTTFTPICHNNRIWLTATEVGLALEYADDKAVQPFTLVTQMNLQI